MKENILPHHIFLCLSSDYGLTVFRREDFEATSNGFNCGNVNRLYCAPEVMLGSSSNMTVAADVYRCVQGSQFKQLIVVTFCTRTFQLNQRWSIVDRLFHVYAKCWMLNLNHIWKLDESNLYFFLLSSATPLFWLRLQLALTSFQWVWQPSL